MAMWNLLPPNPWRYRERFPVPFRMMAFYEFKDPPSSTPFITSWTAFFNAGGCEGLIGLSAILNKQDHVTESFMQRLAGRIWNVVIFESDHELDPAGPVDENALADPRGIEFVRRLALFIVDTHPLKSFLIDSLEERKANLLDTVKSRSRGASSDYQMPQVDPMSGDPLDYDANLPPDGGTRSRTDSEDDLMTLAQRLQDVERSINDYYREWTDEAIESLRIGREEIFDEEQP